MTNTVALNPSESKALNLNQFKQAVFKFETEESMVDFSVFRRCFTSGRTDWVGRAYAFLGYVSSYLFWEETLINRMLLDDGKIGGYSYRYEMILGENDQEECRTKALYYLIKAIRSGCALNSELKANIGEYFITRKIERSDESGPYNYSLKDSIRFVHSFSNVFDNNWGGSGVRDIRWDVKLRNHNRELAMVDCGRAVA